MNAGFSNLATLKQWLLPVALLSDTTCDTVIAQLGLGVAGMFEQYCNRSFQRTVGAQDVLAADRVTFLLNRYPVEAITSIELKTSEAGGWVAQTLADTLKTVDLAAGIVRTYGELGDASALVRITYTGGYWWDTTEDSSGTQPNGSASLPSNLRFAWLTQCQQVWAQLDKLGTSIAEKPGAVNALAALEIPPLLHQSLRDLVRENWT